MILDLLFTKEDGWIHEKEWRFVTTDIESDQKRSIKFSRSLITEVVLGMNISLKHEEEITLLLRNEYLSKVKLFKVGRNESSYGFRKAEIQY